MKRDSLRGVNKDGPFGLKHTLTGRKAPEHPMTPMDVKKTQNILPG